MALKILLHALVLIGSLPVVLLVHELMHALVAVALGWNITEFKPWPHRLDGRLVFGSVQYTAENRTRTQLWIFLLAPMMFSFLSALLFWVLGYVVSSYLSGVAIAFSLDWLWFLKGYALMTPGSDGEQLKRSVSE